MAVGFGVRFGDRFEREFGTLWYSRKGGKISLEKVSLGSPLGPELDDVGEEEGIVSSVGSQ